MKILCVDDDKTSRMILEEGLMRGHPDDEISIAKSGEEALEALKGVSFDIVLTDMIMPGISGLELLETIKNKTPATAVIVITGQSSVDTAVKAMHLGARDYLEKPINIALLTEKIDNVRDYLLRSREAEEYRLAKETVEQQADKDTHLLEKRLQDAEAAIDNALQLLTGECEEEQLAVRVGKAVLALKSCGRRL